MLYFCKKISRKNDKIYSRNCRWDEMEDLVKRKKNAELGFVALWCAMSFSITRDR